MTSKPNIDGALSVIDAAILHVTNPAAITLPTAAGLRRARAEIVAIFAELDTLRAAALAMNSLAVDWNRAPFAAVIMPDRVQHFEDAFKGLDAALRATNPDQDKTMTDEIEIPEGFTTWPGGECPVHADAKVDIVLRNRWRNPKDLARADCWVWIWDAPISSGDIIAYRVVTP